jgi:hypothetical protein
MASRENSDLMCRILATHERFCNFRSRNPQSYAVCQHLQKAIVSFASLSSEWTPIQCFLFLHRLCKFLAVLLVISWFLNPRRQILGGDSGTPHFNTTTALHTAFAKQAPRAEFVSKSLHQPCCQREPIFAWFVWSFYEILYGPNWCWSAPCDAASKPALITSCFRLVFIRCRFPRPRISGAIDTGGVDDRLYSRYSAAATVIIIKIVTAVTAVITAVVNWFLNAL